MSDERENIIDRMFKTIGKHAEETGHEIKKEAEDIGHKTASAAHEMAQKVANGAAQACSEFEKDAADAGHAAKEAVDVTGKEIEKETRS